MAFKFIRISVCDLDSGSDALNRFLQGHRVESVERRFVEDHQNSYWLFCVEYQERQPARASEPSAGPRRKERVDYRELLNDDDFQVYLGLKELRKQLADEEKVAMRGGEVVLQKISRGSTACRAGVRRTRPLRGSHL